MFSSPLVFLKFDKHLARIRAPRVTESLDSTSTCHKIDSADMAPQYFKPPKQPPKDFIPGSKNHRVEKENIFLQRKKEQYTKYKKAYEICKDKTYTKVETFQIYMQS